MNMFDEVGDTLEQSEAQPGGALGFATYILLSALRAPKAAQSGQAGRTVAGLVNLLATDGAAAEVTRFLAPEPGGRATFDVLSYTSSAARFGEERLPPPPPLSRVGLDISGALREVARLALAARRIEVVAVSPEGLRRRVLEREERGSLRFIYPVDRAYEGDPIHRAAAVQDWERLTNPEPPPERSRPPAAAGPPDAVEVAPPAANAPPEPAVAAYRGPSPMEFGEAVREALADVTVEVDLGAIEAMIKDTVKGMVSEAPLPVPVEVQRDELSPPRVDEIAERVAALLAPRLAIPFNSGGPEGSGAWVAQATLMSAAAQLHIQIESFNDRIRAGSRALETLADELSSRERSASDLTAQLAKSVEASLSRLSHRIDTRLDTLERSDSGSAIAAGLQDVVEKLRTINRRLDESSREQPGASISPIRPAGY